MLTLLAKRVDISAKSLTLFGKKSATFRAKVLLLRGKGLNLLVEKFKS